MDKFLKLRRTLMQANAVFLTLMGGVVGILDYIGYRTGQGPLGRMLHGNDLTIGMQEAHGLAFLFGLALFLYAVPDMRPSWHLLCIGIHALLGGSNIIYWNGAVEYGIVGPEIVVTTIHVLFVGFHFIAFFLARDTQSSVETQFRGIS